MSFEKKFMKVSFILGLGAIFSKILAVVKEQYAFYLFQAGWDFDAFISSYRIPNFFRLLLGEGALLPLFISFYARETWETSFLKRRFASQVYRYILWSIFAITLLTFLLAPWYVPFFHQGSENMSLVIHLQRITIWYIPFTILHIFYFSMMYAHQKYWVPAIAPVIGNVVGIVFLSIFTKSLGIDALAYAYVLNSMVVYVLSYYFIHKSGLLGRVASFPMEEESIEKSFAQTRKSFFVSLVPLLLAICISQGLQFILNYYISVEEGANTIYSRANLVHTSLLGILTIGMQAMALPKISSMEEVKDKIAIYWRMMYLMTWMLIPFVLVYLLLHQEISFFLFFDLFPHQAEKLSTYIKQAKGIGEVLFMHSPVAFFVPLLTLSVQLVNGMQRYRTTLVSVFLGFVLSWLLFVLFGYHISYTRYPLMLGLGYLVQMMSIHFFLRQDFRAQSAYGKYFLYLFKLILLAICIYALVFPMKQAWDTFFPVHQVWRDMVTGALFAILLMMFYLVGSRLIQDPTHKQILESLKRIGKRNR